jgi:hypothetical protein
MSFGYITGTYMRVIGTAQFKGIIVRSEISDDVMVLSNEEYGQLQLPSLLMICITDIFVVDFSIKFPKGFYETKPVILPSKYQTRPLTLKCPHKISTLFVSVYDCPTLAEDTPQGDLFENA